MKKFIAIPLLLLTTVSLAACGNNSKSANKPEKAENKTTKSVKKKTVIPTDPDHEWFYKDNIFYAGMETMTLTGSEVRDGAEPGSKVLVLHTTILNNSKKEQDPSNFYMVIHAKQKTDTSNVDLTPGTLALDDNGNSPFQQEEDNLNNALLPGKKVNAVIMFTLKNTNKVTVEFSNSDFDKLGTKTYTVK